MIPQITPQNWASEDIALAVTRTLLCCEESRGSGWCLGAGGEQTLLRVISKEQLGELGCKTEAREVGRSEDRSGQHC